MGDTAVILTDYSITALCVVLCWRLWVLNTPNSHLRNNFFMIFACAGLAAGLGGYFHSIEQTGAEKTKSALWLLTLASIGVSSYNIWLVNARLVLANRTVNRARNILRILLLVYVLVITTVSTNFIVAIASYIPAAIVLFLLTIKLVLRDPNKKNILGVIGLLLTFVAAYVQQVQFSLHPVYMNYNAFYHVLQAMGFIALYLFADSICRRSSFS